MFKIPVTNQAVKPSLEGELMKRATIAKPTINLGHAGNHIIGMLHQPRLHITGKEHFTKPPKLEATDPENFGQPPVYNG